MAIAAAIWSTRWSAVEFLLENGSHESASYCRSSRAAPIVPARRRRQSCIADARLYDAPVWATGCHAAAANADHRQQSRRAAQVFLPDGRGEGLRVIAISHDAGRLAR